MISSVLTEWRQGDFTTDASVAIRLAYHEEDGPRPKGSRDHKGMVVVSQTCDIIREVEKQGTVIVASLIEVDEATYANVKRRSAPRYIIMPEAGDNIVADLTTMMTIEKQLVAQWDRSEGFSDQERINFSRAVALFFSRPALPDSLVSSLGRFRKEVLRKAPKLSTEFGKILNCVEEFRINEVADGQYQLLVYLVDMPELDGTRNRDEIAGKVETSIQAALGEEGLGALIDTPILITTADDQTAREYLQSIPLDLNILSSPISS